MFQALFNIDNFYYFSKDNDTYIKIFSRSNEWKPLEFKEHIGLVSTAKISSEITSFVNQNGKFESNPITQTKEFYVVELRHNFFKQNNKNE